MLEANLLWCMISSNAYGSLLIWNLAFVYVPRLPICIYKKDSSLICCYSLVISVLTKICPNFYNQIVRLDLKCIFVLELKLEN